MGAVNRMCLKRWITRMYRRKHKSQSKKSDSFIGDLLDMKNIEKNITTIKQVFNDLEKTVLKKKENPILKIGKYVAVFITISTLITIIGNITLSNYEKIYRWYALNILNPSKFAQDSTEYIHGWDDGKKNCFAYIDSVIVPEFIHPFSDGMMYRIIQYVTTHIDRNQDKTRSYRLGYSDASDEFSKRLSYSKIHFWQNPEIKQQYLEGQRSVLIQKYVNYLKEPFMKQSDSLIRKGLERAKKYGWDINAEEPVLSEKQIMIKIAEAIEKNNQIQSDFKEELTEIKYDIGHLSQNFEFLCNYDLKNLKSVLFLTKLSLEESRKNRIKSLWGK